MTLQGHCSSSSWWWWWHCWLLMAATATSSATFGGDFDSGGAAVVAEPLLDGINLEQSIAAVLQKVAYGSTTKRSIPDAAYPVTTLATPLLTTYRYSDGGDEYYRVDVKTTDNRDIPRAHFDYDEDGPGAVGGGGGEDVDEAYDSAGYGSDLEKDHVLPTSAPSADILKNHHNAQYENPNRYKNDRARPHYDVTAAPPSLDAVRTTTMGALRNVRPTKSIYSKDVPSYVPPSRAFFTPPLPPEYLNPFADKPTLRGTNSDGFVNRRPIPPPSLMPNKDRIPFRPDLPPSKVINVERVPQTSSSSSSSSEHTLRGDLDKDKKKSLNTPSQSGAHLDRLGDFYGLNRHNESANSANSGSFEYEKAYIPSITRILSGSNGRHDEIPDVLLRTVTATPTDPQREPPKIKTRTPSMQSTQHGEGAAVVAAAAPPIAAPPHNQHQPDEPITAQHDRSASVIVHQSQAPAEPALAPPPPLTTQSSELNHHAPPTPNVTKAGAGDEVWLIAWNVHVYLAVLCYALLACYSIYKLVRYERAPHMFGKAYFLTIHLLLTAVCVLRIFYLTYDAYNVARSFNALLYDFLHAFPLSLLATTFATLILFLLKHTLTHLRVKTRPVFLVLFGVLHMALCVACSALDALGYVERASVVVCRTIFVLLAWALGVSYLYLYRIIANVLAKRKAAQNGGEEGAAARTSYASHITIAVALLFVLLGVVQLYALFFIKVDRFDAGVKHHWMLWSFELSVRFLEVCIITLLVVVVSLKLSRDKQTEAGGGGGGGGAGLGSGAAGGALQLFPCTTTSETSSSDNMYPNNCSSNPNAMHYSRQEMALDAMPQNGGYADAVHYSKNGGGGGTLERASTGGDFERFERPKWGSERFDRVSTSSRSTSNGKGGAYYKPAAPSAAENPYSEPVDQSHAYERTRHDFERSGSDFDRRSSRTSSNTSGGRRSTTGRSRKAHARPHLGVQTLPAHDRQHISAAVASSGTTTTAGSGGGGGGGSAAQLTETMIVDEQGFVRFRHMQDLEYNERMAAAPKHARATVAAHHPHHHHNHHPHHHILNELGGAHYSDA